mmetsp:Transcript_16608/g.38885  ORF Transcript_16608/g.38885 Transcript_16608/m.38885 type:complete len:300 (+) Transcript_16608:98-997(+)
MGCGASATSSRRYAQQEKVEVTVSAEEPKHPKTLQKDDSTGRPRRDSSHMVAPEKMRAIKRAFDAVDTNKNGTIGMDELKKVLDMLDKDGHKLSDEEQSHLFQTIDKDQNNQVQYEEFLAWVLAQDDTSGCLAEWAMTEGILDVHKVAMSGTADQAKELLESSTSNVNVADVRGVTPLHFACRRGNVDVAKVLLEAKADVNLKTHLGRQPLHAVAEQGSTSLAKMLLEAGANIEAGDARMQTPLHWGVRSNQSEVVKLLVDSRADLSAKTIGGYTPYSMAEDWSSAPMRELLRSLGGTR